MNIVQRGVHGLFGFLFSYERWVGHDAFIELDYVGGCIHEYGGLNLLSK